jgi:TonB family protein
MPETLEQSDRPLGFPDRRLHARRQTRSLAYIDLGEDNGGLVLNFSETGVAVHAAVMMAGDHLPKMRFQLPHSLEWVEAEGRVTWTGDSKKEAGIEFVGLPEGARTQIRDWLTSKEPAYEPPSVRRRAVDARKISALAVQPVAAPAAPAAPEPEPAELLPAEAAPATNAVEPAFESSASSEAMPAPRETAEDAPPLREMIETPHAVRETPGGVPPLREMIETPSAPREAKSPFTYAPRAARISGWPHNSAFTRRAQAAESAANLSAPAQRKWLALAAGAAVLVAVSFVAGIATGKGSWNSIFASAKNLVAGTSAPAAVAAPQTGAGGAGESQTEPAASSNVSAPDTRGSGSGGAPSQREARAPSSGGASGGGAGGAAGGAAAQPANGEPATQSLIVRRAAAAPQAERGANSAGGANASGEENAASVLSMPDTPVSASHSVAISSRLYIPLPAATSSPGTQRGGNLQIGRLENRVEVAYPADAEQQRMEGIVKLHVTIGTDGAVENVAALSGAAVLASAATDAVKQWRYKPTMMDGHAIETEADITIVFRLPQSPP